MDPPRPGGANLHCKDVQAFFDYLTKVLEFTPMFRVRKPGGGSVFAGASWGPARSGQRLVLGDIHEALHGHYDHGEFGRTMEQHPLGTGVVLYFYVDDVDAYYGRIVARGAQIDEPPTDQFWGERTISVLAPEGYYFTFAQPIPNFQFPERLAAATEQFDTAPPH